MRALVITQHGPPEVLKVLDRPDPVPGPGEVRIAVKAAGVNFADVMARMGLYPDAPELPFVPGYEIAGEVEAVGEGVEGVEPGDRVTRARASAARPSSRPRGDGDVVALPDGLELREGRGAARGLRRPHTPASSATAMCARRARARPRGGRRRGDRGDADREAPGRRGVRHGVRGEARRDPRVQGMDHAIDYRSQDFVDEIRRITGEKSRSTS